MSSSVTYVSPNTQGQTTIQLFTDKQNGLTVKIDTDRLHLRSVEPTEDDVNHYADLFGDPDVMEKHGTGETKMRDEVENRIKNVWVKRWREKDPYSGMAIFKSNSDDFIGHVILDHGDHPGESEVDYLLNRKDWGKGYESEAVTAVVQKYAPTTVHVGYKLEGKPLKQIVARVRPDNPDFEQILQKAGMHLFSAQEKFGPLRHIYSINLSEIQ